MNGILSFLQLSDIHIYTTDTKIRINYFSFSSFLHFFPRSLISDFCVCAA